MLLWFIIKRWLRNIENVRSESLPIVFDDVIEFYHWCTCTKSDMGLRTFWIIKTQWNTECKTWNNDHHAV